MEGQIQSLDDLTLVRMIVDHDADDCREELFRRYKNRIYVWCFNIAHDQEEALDLTQEVFLKIFRGLSRFQGEAKFSTWAFQIARNHCLTVEASRKQQWRKNLVSVEGVDAPDTTIVEELRQAELADELADILEKASQIMKEDELEAFVLHYRDGLTIKEINRVLGCTNVSGARALIQNARRKFDRFVGRKPAAGTPNRKGRPYD